MYTKMENTMTHSLLISDEFPPSELYDRTSGGWLASPEYQPTPNKSTSNKQQSRSNLVFSPGLFLTTNHAEIRILTFESFYKIIRFFTSQLIFNHFLFISLLNAVR